MAATIAAPVSAESPVAGGPGLQVRVGQADDFSRIEFHWASPAQMTTRRDGQKLIVSFNRDAKPDLSVLHVAPPKWLKSADAQHHHGALILVLTLDADADAATGVADGASFVNIFAKKPDAAAATPAARPRADPVPPGGVVTMRAAVAGSQIRFDFPWRNPCGAAVFRRGDAIWIVFDAAAKIDVAAAPKGAVQFDQVKSFAGPGYSAIRITTRAPVAFTAAADGSDWGVTLEPLSLAASDPIKLGRDDASGPVNLTAALAGPTGLFWIADPAVGDKIGVVTAFAPAKGLPTRHDFVQVSLLQSAQGLAIEPHTDDLSVTLGGDIVSLSRKDGLTLSPAGAGRKPAAANLGAPQPAALPGLIPADWGDLGGGAFLPRYDALLAPVADEEAKGGDGPTAAHLALARFLVGSQLSFEAIGILNDTLRTHESLGSDAEFRALRGMARVMAGRYKEAQIDLAAPALEDNPAIALWRGYLLAKLGQWTDAKRQFSAGVSSLSQFPVLWRARFARAAAETALALGDTGGAHSWIGYALMYHADPVEDAQSQLVQAEVAEQQGDTADALVKYKPLENSPLDAVAGPAVLRATGIQLAKGAVTPMQAAGVFESLRYRWRGGSFELETVRALGHLYLSQGRYREALEALRSTGQQLPDVPEAMQLQADLAAAFKSLFLDGQADGLEPVQALALFYDFKELTPVGADGDAMVRRLTRRLVDADLLPQAETLLKYQVDNRLDGAPKAQVAADLAVIYLMDRKPEDALEAINASRTTVLPMALNLQRRILTARALTGLGRYDVALETLGTDESADAVDARGEVAWRQKAWPAAGALFEKMLGDRFKTPGPLSSEEEGKLLRAAVAYSLGADDSSLARLRDRYSGFVAASRNPDALRVALSGLNGGKVAPADFSRVAADGQMFEGWVDRMKIRFRQVAPPSPRPPLRANPGSA
jgi:tetratricopeptide (TPR) repeat protein